MNPIYVRLKKYERGYEIVFIPLLYKILLPNCKGSLDWLLLTDDMYTEFGAMFVQNLSVKFPDIERMTVARDYVFIVSGSGRKSPLEAGALMEWTNSLYSRIVKAIGREENLQFTG